MRLLETFGVVGAIAELIAAAVVGTAVAPGPRSWTSGESVHLEVRGLNKPRHATAAQALAHCLSPVVCSGKLDRHYRIRDRRAWC
ncbi:hypothetical protein [Amycolatopsis sp. FDAARGOS 1241]|uniref:hypothetical protein n=1 Tax=Amycolatopsis sp. FDAARGOS 1241 TaxID=2778070 RepID=UPI001951C64E|nr:hypothetical protein [Amycolatopsis sp. FDAARGOS 1241]QRP45765.1 hypothetical protein I6J71_42900 [Amycolatopsis sp. FDAARGOS 1241]